MGARARAAAHLPRRGAGPGGGRRSPRRRRRLEGDLTVTDAVWSDRDTTPAAIEAALRDLLRERQTESSAHVPARVLNLVVIVDARWSGEIANRLASVGRFHPSRTIICAVEPGRETLDAVASLASDHDGSDDALALVRETVVVRCGERHLAHLDTVVDPLVVSDLSTLVWAPHGHTEAVDVLLRLAQVVLLDSVDDPEAREGLDRACRLAEEAYVVDLAWLRSTPWRERVAATFDPARLRPDLRGISCVTVRHHPESAAAGLLLLGWMASRLGWEPRPLESQGGGVLSGHARGPEQDVSLRLEPARELSVRGLAGLQLETASGRCLRLDRGPGGLHARYTHARGTSREWTVLGASRGEAGILAEGIRQALLRDPTYHPALLAAREMMR